jgi:hypothetical protein
MGMNILSISQYGSGLLSAQALSGAIDRQKDYASILGAYTVLVPGDRVVVSYGDSLRVHGIPSKNIFFFLFGAYRVAIALHKKHNFDAVMVDNAHLGGCVGLMFRGTTESVLQTASSKYSCVLLCIVQILFEYQHKLKLSV